MMVDGEYMWRATVLCSVQSSTTSVLEFLGWIKKVFVQEHVSGSSTMVVPRIRPCLERFGFRYKLLVSMAVFFLSTSMAVFFYQPVWPL